MPSAAPGVVVDTGPLIAALDADEAHHAWARATLGRLRPPLLTREAVLTEVSFLLGRARADPALGPALASRGAVRVVPVLSEEGEADAVERLMRRTADLPMSLTDACLVRIVERTADASVLTLDADFRVYRQHGRRRIPVLMP